MRLAPRRVLVALCVAIGLWLLLLPFASAVSAHATLLRADPAAGGSFTEAPEAITVWLSEPVEAKYSSIEVLQADGSRVRTGDLVALDGDDPALRLPVEESLSDGSYTVVWSVLSKVDSHVSEGFFSFTVGDALLPEPDQEAALARQAASDQIVPPAVEAVARWLSLLGQAALAGAFVFVSFVLAPARRSSAQDGVPARRFRHLFVLSLAALVAGHVVSAVLQVMDATRSTSLDVLGAPLLSLLIDTRYGALWLTRVVLIIAIGVLIWAISRRDRLMPVHGRGRPFWRAAIGVSGLLLLTTSLGSHAAARGGTLAWPVVNDWLHLAGTSVWVGGLVAFALSVGWLDAATTREVVRRFSALALGAVVLLIITGLIAARLQAVSLTGIVTTHYGMWLTLKLAIVAATLGFGAWHLLVVRPALQRAEAGSASPDERRFRRSLRVEAGLALVVLIVTALLTTSVPARDLLDSGTRVFAATRLTREASVTLRVTPGRIGPNDFSVAIQPLDPDAFADLQRVYLRFTPAADTDAAGAGSQRVQLRQIGASGSLTFIGTGAYLALEGDWEVTAIIRRAGVLDQEVPFAVAATDDGLSPADLGSPVASDSGSGRVAQLGALWLLVAATLAMAGLRMRAYRTSLGWSMLALAALSLVMGSFLVLAGGGMSA